MTDSIEIVKDITLKVSVLPIFQNLRVDIWQREKYKSAVEYFERDKNF